MHCLYFQHLRWALQTVPARRSRGLSKLRHNDLHSADAGSDTRACRDRGWQAGPTEPVDERSQGNNVRVIFGSEIRPASGNFAVEPSSRNGFSEIASDFQRATRLVADEPSGRPRNDEDKVYEKKWRLVRNTSCLVLSA